ncbi:hypothetical protein [Methylobacterium sp. JK268]
MSSRLARLALRIGGLILLGVVPARGQERPDSTALRCAEAARLVAGRGAIVLGTGGFTYDRFVRDRSFCGSQEITERALVPSRDDRSCFVGYRCKDINRDPTGVN